MTRTLGSTAFALLLVLRAGAVSAGEAPSSPGTAPVSPSSVSAPARKGYLLFRSEFPDPEAIKPYGRAVIPLAAMNGWNHWQVR